jgi:SAM-dependent methyltransferase
MTWNEEFFRTFWPAVGPAITGAVADTRGEITSLLRKLRLRPGARILDVPCGFGRHAVELARRGFRVTGVDISPELIAQARQAAAAKGVTVEFRCGDMRRLAYRRRFDAVLNLFTSFGYFGDAADLKLLERFYQALRPGGWVALHLINRDWVLRNFQATDRQRMGGYLVAEKRTFDFDTSVLTCTWSARRGRRRWRGTTRLRLYSCHELVRMMEQAGFSTVRSFPGSRTAPARLESRWLLLLGRR